MKFEKLEISLEGSQDIEKLFYKSNLDSENFSFLLVLTMRTNRAVFS